MHTKSLNEIAILTSNERLICCQFQLTLPLDSVIGLHQANTCLECVPRIASAFQVRGVVQSSDLIIALDKLQRKTFVCVPTDTVRSSVRVVDRMIAGVRRRQTYWQ